MKNSLLRTVMTVLAACFCTSCIYDYYPEDPVTVGYNEICLTFDMRMLGYGATRADGSYPAERISTLRVVIVDLGLDNEGKKMAEPKVERNILMDNVSLEGEAGSGLPAGVVRLQFPKIRADRRKKIYLLINSEPTRQTYLDLRRADGTPINTLNLDEDNKLFLPDDNGKVPIEDATFVSPKGSYNKNSISTGEVLLVPMTAFHTISIPSIEKLIEEYPTLHTNIIYQLPSELYVVRAINKITFEFCNETCSNGFEGMDLLVREWSISKINDRAYMFGHPDDNGDLYSEKTSDLENQVNEPWMQWLKEEAERTQPPTSSTSDYRWLTEYSMPNNSVSETYSFRPGTYTGDASTGTPKDEDGYVLPAPTTVNKVTSLDTENEPVYFGESQWGNPQQYELAFTVWQRTNEQESWNTPYTYRAVSTDGSKFNIQSLFRSTHLVVKVTFHSGMGRPDFEIDVHPYGSYELDPVFGL